ANAAPSPFAIRRRHILGHEHHVRRPADEPTLRRIRPGLNQREHRAAVGWRDRDDAVTGADAGVKCDAKSERFLVETQASLLIFDVDVHSVYAEIRIRRCLRPGPGCHDHLTGLPARAPRSPRTGSSSRFRYTAVEG